MPAGVMKWARSRLAPVVLVGLAAGWTIWFSWQSNLNAAVADVPSQDLPHAWQTVWNVAHGYGFQYTDLIQERTVARLSAHADYILLLFAPLARIWNDYGLLLIGQILIVVSGAWAVWRIAARQTGSGNFAALLTFAYLMYGPLQFAVTFQFHGVTLAVAFMLWAIEAMLAKRRWWVVGIWCLLALATKEQVGLIIGPLLFWVGMLSKRRRLAGALLGLSLLWSIVHFVWLIPAMRPADDPHLFWKFYYGSLGDTPGEIIRNLLRPETLISRLGTSEHVQSVIALLLPLGFLPVISWFSVISLAAVLPHWLADYFAVYSIYYHNHVLALPALFFAAIQARRYLQQKTWWPRHAMILGVGWGLCIVTSTFLFSPNPWSMKYLPVFRAGDPRISAMKELDRRIPPRATVTMAWGLPPIFRDHPEVFVLPGGVNRADYVVVGESALPAFRAYAPEYAAELRRYFDESKAFELISEQSGIAVFRRRFDLQPEPLPDEFRDPTLNGLQSAG